MKTRHLCAYALITTILSTNLVFAQAPAGVARVDSDTYFDTSFSNTNYSGGQNDFAEYPDDPASSWFDFENQSSKHAGLLGKTYVRGAYVYNGVDDDGAIDYDAFEGWDAEFNTPIPWISSDTLAADFITEFEHRQVSGIAGATKLKIEADFIAVGVRLFAMPNSRIRPYVALGASFVEFSFEATGFPSTEDDDDEFVISVGIEADLAANASIRGDFEIDRDDVDESTFEGTVVLWLGENVFFRGGGVIPLDDDFDPGVTIGGGVAFR
jgi:hypothetical protein